MEQPDSTCIVEFVEVMTDAPSPRVIARERIAEYRRKIASVTRMTQADIDGNGDTVPLGWRRRLFWNAKKRMEGEK